MFLLRNKDAEYIHVVLVNIISIVGALNSADRFLFHDPKVPCLMILTEILKEANRSKVDKRGQSRSPSH